MKLHANARTCPNSRKLLVSRIEEERWSLRSAAEAAGISERTAAKWLARWRSEGAAGLRDRSSAPKLRPTQLPADRVRAIEALRRLRMTAAEIAEVLDMALSTVSRWLKRIGLGKRSRLEPPEPPNRYERKRPGELIHVDVKKLGRIRGVGHRISGSRASQKKMRREGRRTGALAGSSSTSASMTPPGSPTSRSWPTRRARPPPGSCGGPPMVQPHGDHGRAGDDRQRLLLPLPRPRRGLQGARHAPPIHPPLPAPHQRQGRALHPDARQPLGLRRHLRLLGRAHRGATRLADPLQLQPTTRLPRS